MHTRREYSNDGEHTVLSTKGRWYSEVIVKGVEDYRDLIGPTIGEQIEGGRVTVAKQVLFHDNEYTGTGFEVVEEQQNVVLTERKKEY